MFTNKENISLTIAVWLAADDGYDHQFDPNVFSATELLQPIRMIVLKRQMAAATLKGEIDIVDLVSSRVGNAVHSAAEISWIENRHKAFNNLDLPQSLRDRIRINPESPGPNDAIDVHIEQRSRKEIMGYIITGKYDFVLAGVVEDIKTTKTYNWIHGGNDEKYGEQLSIYKWLEPELIRADWGNIHFLFTDWKQHLILGNPDYPNSPIKTRKVPLMSIEETESFIRAKLTNIIPYLAKPQHELPLCTREELWQSLPTFKWYKNGQVGPRSTKNFNTYMEAVDQSGGVGLIVEHPAKAKRCNYCDARMICTQAAQLSDDKLLD